MDKRREKLLGVIHAIENAMTADNSSMKLVQDIKVLKSDMEEDFFSIVVLGEFKRGKSTFINALLGEELLIADVLPETATIQAIMHSDEKKAQVLFWDKTTQEGPASKEFLMQFSAKGEADASKVKYIKIGHPSVFINDKVVLIDTPGVSDMNEQRVQVTYDFIPKANAVLFVLDATSPMKRTEKEFIEEYLLTQGITKIIFILNKMDMFDDEEEDLDEYLDLVRKRIGNAFEDDRLTDIQIMPVSAYLAMKGIREEDDELVKESNILNVKKRLIEILSEGDIEQAKLIRYKERLINIVDKWKMQAKREIALYKTDIESLENQFHNVQQLMESGKEKYLLIDQYVEREKEFVFSIVNKSLNKFYDDLIYDVEYEISRYQGTEFKAFIERDIPHIIKKKTENWMSTHLVGVDRVLNQLEQKLSEALSRYFNKKVFVNTISQEVDFKPCMQMTANDISSAGVGAGLVTAAGAIALSAIGGSMFMPLVSMAVFPMLRQQFIKNSLDREKGEVLPNVKNEVRQYVWMLQREIEKSIEKRISDMMILVQNNYERSVQVYVIKMQKCIEERKGEAQQITEKVQHKESLYVKVETLLKGIANL